MNERTFWVLALALSGAIGVAVLLHLRNADVSRLPTSEAPESAPRVDVARMLRALQLVTVTIDTKIQSASTDESWRGDVRARVSAPVRYFYAIDLSQVSESTLTRDPATGALRIVVPPPRRLAVEVFSADADADVRVGGTRLRDVAGEYHLGLARASLHQRAREAALSPADLARLESMSRVQMAELVRVITGSEGRVTVEFQDPATPETPASGGAPGAGGK